MDGDQDGVSTTATGFALTTFNAATNVLSVWATHNVQNATLAHIHGPAAPGVSAGVQLTLASTAAAAQTVPFVQTFTLTSDQVSYLNAGLLYYNVHSLTYGNGEIRGQIDPIINYVTELNGYQDNQTTSDYGVGLVALYGSSLNAYCFHTVSDPTAAHIHTAAPWVMGPATFPFTSATSPIVQNFTATAQQQTDLQNGNDYFNVHTDAAQNGLIRGQIYAKTVAQGLTTANPTTATTATTTSSAPTTIASGFVVLAMGAMVALFA